MTTPRRKIRPMFEKDLGISPLRKSAVCSTPFPDHVVNDDEIERSRRRSILESAKRQSSVVHINRTVTPSSDTTECTDQHYNTCLKLFMENKISTKNVWQIHIIEYMRSRLIKDGVEMQDHIQMASASLEIAAKVYGMRVDDMHQESQRLITFLMEVHTEGDGKRKANNNDEEVNANSDNEIEIEVAQKPKEKRKKKRLTIGNMTGIIASNEDTLNAKLTFHNSSYKQQGKQLNVLTAAGSLAVKEELLVPYRGSIPFWTPLPPANADVTFSKLVPAKIIQTPGIICPSFNDFIADQWDPNDDTFHQSRSSEHILYDDNGFPIPELDTTVSNLDARNDNDHWGGACSDLEEEMVAGAHAALHTEVAHITEMRPNEKNVTSENGIRSLEYSYISAPVIGERYAITGVWAGPSHWKLKSLQPRASTATTVQGVTAHKQKRGPRVEILQMNFLEIDEKELEYLLSLKKRTIKKKRQHIDEFTLPEDLCVERSECHTLMSIPAIHIRMAAGRVSESCNENLNITNYDYDNPNDADYCSQTLTDVENADGLNDELMPAAEQSIVEYNNMIDEPNYVTKTIVPYATQAKRMDMKKLKEAIWNELVNIDQINCSLTDDTSPATERLLSISFEKMYDGLPNRVSDKMTSELSIPLAFVALLHLANERNLKLIDQPDLLDIHVSTVT